MAITNTTPLKFELPDGQVSLISWEFVESKIRDFMEGATASMNTTNGYLERIDTRIQEWLDEQQPTNGD